jgi:hypothetical protein
MEAEPAVRSALMAVGRLNRLLGQIHNRSREPIGMTDWDQDDKNVIVTQMVAAIAMTGEGLRLAADELQAAVADADPVVGLLLAALSNANDEQLAHTRKLREEITELRSLLEHAGAKHASLADELVCRKKLTGRWEIAVRLLETAEPGLLAQPPLWRAGFGRLMRRRLSFLARQSRMWAAPVRHRGGLDQGATMRWRECGKCARRSAPVVVTESSCAKGSGRLPRRSRDAA